MVGTEYDAAAAVQPCIRSSGRLRTSQQCFVRLPFGRRVQRFEKLHLAGGK
jgi:hypothetical protein